LLDQLISTSDSKDRFLRRTPLRSAERRLRRF
jgi:hypothetical protein